MIERYKTLSDALTIKSITKSKIRSQLGSDLIEISHDVSQSTCP
jgi:hypothetical protein